MQRGLAYLTALKKSTINISYYTTNILLVVNLQRITKGIVSLAPWNL